MAREVNCLSCKYLEVKTKGGYWRWDNFGKTRRWVPPEPMYMCRKTWRRLDVVVRRCKLYVPDDQVTLNRWLKE